MCISLCWNVIQPLKIMPQTKYLLLKMFIIYFYGESKAQNNMHSFMVLCFVKVYVGV